jgi:hypothetical protein
MVVQQSICACGVGRRRKISTSIEAKKSKRLFKKAKKKSLTSDRRRGDKIMRKKRTKINRIPDRMLQSCKDKNQLPGSGKQKVGQVAMHEDEQKMTKLG